VTAQYGKRFIHACAEQIVLTCLLLGAMAAQAEVTLTTQAQRVVPADPGAGVTRETLVPVAEVVPGDVIRYTIVFENASTQDVAAGSVVITNPLPDGCVYVDGSATGDNTRITFSVDGDTFEDPDSLLITEASGSRRATPADYRSIRWAYALRLPAGGSGAVSFDVRLR
jgi:uncharacterized repeat protein (TIGR01451 family)